MARKISRHRERDGRPVQPTLIVSRPSVKQRLVGSTLSPTRLLVLFARIRDNIIPTDQSPSSGNSSGQIAFIFLLAVISNLVLAAVLPPITQWGTEVTRIAASIANGNGFSSPFREPTGPSAWIPPVYPYLLAGIFRGFGTFTAAAYWVVVLLNITLHAFACVLLFVLSGEIFGPRVGWYSGCALAGFPLLFFPLALLHVLGGPSGQGLFIPPNLIWYTHFSELAILLLIWLTLHPPNSIIRGAIWGLIVLTNPTVLALAPAFFAWSLWRKESWRALGLSCFLAALCVAPWLVRNYLVFHQTVFIRDNLGVELRVGNQPGYRGRWDAQLHPDRSDVELLRLASVGEVDYAKGAGQEAFRIIRSDPREFLQNTALRVVYWWIGNPLQSHRLGRFRYIKYLPQIIFSVLSIWGVVQALRNKNRPALLFVAVLVFYPLIYYVTHTFEGFFYQYPIQPEMLALAASALIRDRQPSNTLTCATSASIKL